MSDEHPNPDEVLGAFGHAFRLLRRHFHDANDAYGESWAGDYRERVLHEVRCEMGVDR
jgi:hypothetical protein